jgi:putative membrane protein insertion efficiency factor
MKAAIPALVVFSALAWDLSQPPGRQATARAAVGAIHWYHASVSPHLGIVCRFTPSCSVYAAAVIERHGLLAGGWMTVKRVTRCGPWTKAGTVDLPR